MNNYYKNQLSDEQLVARINQGDKQMLEILFDRYIDRLLRYVSLFVQSSEEAKDLTQEIVAKIFQVLSTFRGTGRFEAWFFIVARRTIIDYRRKRHLEVYCYDSDNLERLANKQQIGQESRNETSAEELLSGLPCNEREILQLRFIEGLSYQEISEATNMSQGSLRNLVSRAIKRIQESNTNEL